MNGYTGKILRINLTDRKTSTIDTGAYEEWGGGHGMGSAIFFDLVNDKTIDGFDPANVVTIMTSPLTGTIVPGGGAARVEMQGIGVQSSPIGWFTRSNLGGRFGAMLKYAGWDGIVIEGAANSPVWVDIRNESVQIKSASSLWGLDTWQTQNTIWQEVSGKADFIDWFEAGGEGSGKRSTQRPAVLCIGKAGENKSRIASVIHDAGNGAGQGGFGGVWGAKNLKAVSVIGTGSVQVADAKALLDARAWAMEKYAFKFGEPATYFYFGRSPYPISTSHLFSKARPQACIGCHAGCRCRFGDGSGNETNCMAVMAYGYFDSQRHMGLQTSVTGKAADLLQQYGINAFEVFYGIIYLQILQKMGIVGKGKTVAIDLPFNKLGEYEFIEKLFFMIANRQGPGDAMAEGFYRAAQQWGRQQEDSASGSLVYPLWGLPMHYDPRSYLDWGYGSVLGDRDINEHDFVNLPFKARALREGKTETEAMEEAVQIISEKLAPYAGNPAMLDYSTQNMYSQDIARLVAWQRHYTRFWKQSCLYCDFQFADLLNPTTSDLRGLTGQGEQKFYNAVTGKDLTFSDGMELGRKIWNLDNAIWSLQGRHRDSVQFAEFIYDVPNKAEKYYFTGRENGQWKYVDIGGRCLDKDKFEGWKAQFYGLEGWDATSGWPTRTTLDDLALGYVADELEENGKLGSSAAAAQ